MSDSESKRAPLPPLAPLDHYIEAQHVLRHVRIMERFFEEVADEREIGFTAYSRLMHGYRTILNDELAPHALTLASAVCDLEDAYPEIKRPPSADKD